MLLRLVAVLGVGAACLGAAPSATRSTVDATLAPIPIERSRDIPTAAEFADLVSTDPVAALQASLARYQREVTGFTATFHKQERIGGKLLAPEVIRVWFRDEPFAVLMLWEQGGGLGQGTLYVRGENDGQMKVWVSRLFTKSVPPRGAMPRGSARYTIEEFGLAQSTLRTLTAWAAAKQRGELMYEYNGKRAVPEAGGRECFVLKRTCPTDEIDGFVGSEKVTVTDANRADAVRTVTVYLDCETWLQVGTELRRADGEPAGLYYFRDLRVNPPFDKTTFTTASFRK
jgi:hypothetical protein